MKTANGSVRTLVKLTGRAHQVTGINRLDTPDAEAVAAASEMLILIFFHNFSE